MAKWEVALLKHFNEIFWHYKNSATPHKTNFFKKWSKITISFLGIFRHSCITKSCDFNALFPTAWSLKLGNLIFPVLWEGYFSWPYHYSNEFNFMVSWTKTNQNKNIIISFFTCWEHVFSRPKSEFVVDTTFLP